MYVPAKYLHLHIHMLLVGTPSVGYTYLSNYIAL